MTTIKTKRVYEPASAGDGFRILVDRLWPRGISKERLRGVLWAKEITPSAQLREWFHADEDKRWEEFERKYERELETNDAVDPIVDEIAKFDTATLLFAGKDTVHTHTKVLKSFLEKQLAKR